MFKKNSYIKIEFLPEGKPLVSAHIDNNTDIDMVTNFINNFLMREYLKPVLEVIIENGKKNKSLAGEEIVEGVLSVQKDFEVRRVLRSRRNPIISPGEVMKNFLGDKE